MNANVSRDTLGNTVTKVIFSILISFKLSLIRFTVRCAVLCFVLFLLPKFKSSSNLILTLIYFIFWDVNECDSTPCKNGGTCINTVGDYQCKCKPGYTGKHCDQGNSTNHHGNVLHSQEPVSFIVHDCKKPQVKFSMNAEFPINPFKALQ